MSASSNVLLVARVLTYGHTFYVVLVLKRYLLFKCFSDGIDVSFYHANICATFSAFRTEGVGV